MRDILHCYNYNYSNAVCFFPSYPPCFVPKFFLYFLYQIEKCLIPPPFAAKYHVGAWCPDIKVRKETKHMMTLLNLFGKYILLPAVLFLAVLCGICVLAGASSGTRDADRNAAKDRITQLDAQAEPHFRRAHENAGKVANEETTFANTLKTYGRMLKDKVCGTHTAEEHIDDVVRENIVEPCREGAKVYGCAIEADGIGKTAHDITSDQASATLSQTAATAVNTACTAAAAAAIRQAGAKIASRCAAGAAVACADGPVPIADIAGGAIAAAGVAEGVGEIHSSYKSMPEKLKNTLDHAIDKCRDACREAARK